MKEAPVCEPQPDNAMECHGQNAISGRDYSGMDRLFSVLPKVLRKRGLQEHAEGALVVLRAHRWLEEHFPHLKGSVSVQKYKENTVHILCTHSIAVQECQSSMSDLKAFLHKECAFAGVIDVRVGRN